METYLKYLFEGVIHFNKPTDNMRVVLKATFPNYKGKKFEVVVDNFPTKIDSYWDEGTRTYFSFFDIASKKIYDIGSNHPLFEPNKPRVYSNPLPGVILVSHIIFQGKDIGVTFYVLRDDYEWLAGAPQLNNSDQLTNNQKIVLYYTKSLKSSYAGIKDLRFHEANREKKISKEDWFDAKNWLIKNGYLNSAGAITIKGRNAMEGVNRV
jgi:hypothetical protein